MILEKQMLIINAFISSNQKLVLYSKIVLFAILGFYLIIPNSLINSPMTDLDPSWKISLSLAKKYNLTFGTDYAFTYGPLGYLETKLILSHSYLKIAFFEICFITCFLFMLIKISILNGFKLFDLFLNMLTLFLLSNCYLINILPFVYVLGVLIYLRENNKWYLCISACIALLSFYIKVNYGIVLIFFTVILSFYLLYIDDLKFKHFLAFYVLFLSLLISTAIYFNVNLIGYVKSSLHLISAYNDSMLLDSNRFWEFILGFEIFTLFYIVVIIILINNNYKKDNFKGIVIIMLSGIYMYLLFKNGYVRADHFFGFIKFAPLPFLLIYLYFRESYQKWVVFSILLLCTNFLFMQNKLGKLNFVRVDKKLQGENSDLNAFYTNDTTSIVRENNYFSQLTNESKRSSCFTIKDDFDCFLNSSFVSAIGKHTVDIFPTEISLIFRHNLNYNPRPVVQSYSAYDEYLDSLNYKKIISSNAPEFVIFENWSIDQRNPFWDESITKRGLLTNYKYEDIDTNFKPRKNILLLRRNNSPLKLTTIKEKEVNVKLGEWVKIERSDNLQYLFADVQYTVLGKIKRTLYKPPKLKIVLQYENGKTRIFKAIVTILKTGVLINKSVINTLEAKAFFVDKGKKNMNITGFKIYSDERGFNTDIKCKLIEQKLLSL